MLNQRFAWFAAALTMLFLIQPFPTLEAASSESAPQRDPYTEYQLPWSGASPLGIAVDSNGTVWFAASYTDSLVAFHLSNASYGTYPLPNNSTKCEIWSIAIGPDGKVWLGDSVSNSIWVFQPEDDSFQPYPIPTTNSYPFQLAFGPDGMLYFTELYGSKIGRLSPLTGQIVEFQTPSLTSGPAGFDFDKSGKMWIAEDYTGRLAVFDPKTGDFSERTLAGSRTSLRGVAVDDNGMVWVTDSSSSSLVIFDPLNNSSKIFDTLSSVFDHSSPYLMRKGIDGSIWFNERTGNRIGRIYPDSMRMVEVEFPYLQNVGIVGLPGCCIPEGSSTTIPREILSLAPDASGNVWFTEFLGNAVGVMHSDYSPSFSLTVDAPDSVPRNSSTILNATVSSSSPSPMDLWVGRIIPSSSGNISVNWVWSNPATLESNAQLTRAFSLVIPSNAPLGSYALIFYASDFPAGTVILSSLVTYRITSASEGENPWFTNSIVYLLLLVSIVTVLALIVAWRKLARPRANPNPVG